METPIIDTCIVNESPLIQKIDELTEKVIRRELASVEKRNGWMKAMEKITTLPNVKENIYEYLRNKEVTPLSNIYDVVQEASPLNRLMKNISYQLEYENGMSEESYINAINNTINAYNDEIKKQDEENQRDENQKGMMDRAAKDEARKNSEKESPVEKAGKEGSNPDIVRDDGIANKKDLIKEILKHLNKHHPGAKKSTFKKITKVSQVIKVSAVKRVMPLFKKELATKNLWARVKEPERQLSLVIDDSGSMAEYTGIVEELLVELAKTSTVTACKFDLDPQRVMDIEYRIKTKNDLKKFDYNPGGGDDLHAAIRYGFETKKEKTVIFVTDRSTAFSREECEDIYTRAKKANKNFIIIGLDCDTGLFPGLKDENLIVCRTARNRSR